MKKTLIHVCMKARGGFQKRIIPTIYHMKKFKKINMILISSCNIENTIIFKERIYLYFNACVESLSLVRLMMQYYMPNR